MNGSNNSSQQGLTNKTEANVRLLNLSRFHVVFFRKFYSLAMQRIRDLIDKLNLPYVMYEQARHNNQANNPGCKDTPFANIFNSASHILHTNTQVLQLTPNPTLTPIAPSNTTNGNSTSSQNTFMINEHRETLVRMTWSLFEYSVCVSEARALMMNRHVDQLIMCAVYLACRLNSLPLQFRDITTGYKLIKTTAVNRLAKARVYREVYSEDESGSVDLIKFYNDVYVDKLKSFAGKIMLSAKSTAITASSTSATSDVAAATASVGVSSLTPMIRMSACSSHQYHQFTPRRVSSCDTQSVFVTPSCGPQHSLQIVPPSMQSRAKLTFSLTDLNIMKVNIDVIILLLVLVQPF
jgi:hypothetical protein